MVKLQKFSNEDFDRLISWVDSEKLMLQFAGPIFTFPLSRDQLSNYLKSTSRIAYKITLEDNDKVIGHAEIGNINKSNQSASLCRILIGDKDHREKGYGKHVINQLLSICFNELSLHRVELWVYDFNVSAIKCYQKSGFKTEGLSRESLKVGNEFWSAYLMSMLKNEWFLLNKKKDPEH